MVNGDFHAVSGRTRGLVASSNYYFQQLTSGLVTRVTGRGARGAGRANGQPQYRNRQLSALSSAGQRSDAPADRTISVMACRGPRPGFRDPFWEFST